MILTSIPETHAQTATVRLATIHSGLTSPDGSYRWMDVADQEYSTSYRNTYGYSNANVRATFTRTARVFSGEIIAKNLKPNFAYQIKLVGEPGTPSNERIGFAGRWWQEEWNGREWSNGCNLNSKGDGSSPSPNDKTYFSRYRIADPISPTKRRYRYTAYLVMGYFITDMNGDASVKFSGDSSYHMLSKTILMARTAKDGSVHMATFTPDPSVHRAYDTSYGTKTIGVFGEWERLPVGGIRLKPGDYSCKLILTEESFHDSGGKYIGRWAAAMGAGIQFTITR